ncbi:unnamed protein product [Debaryomyces tyrocola]|nr:unnamed protein product [Debaryomyces tyrocola]
MPPYRNYILCIYWVFLCIIAATQLQGAETILYIKFFINSILNSTNSFKIQIRNISYNISYISEFIPGNLL